MTVKPIPEGHHVVTPYLVVHGAAGVIAFLKETFAAREVHAPMRRTDGTIMHAAVKIGDSLVMMGEPKDDFSPMPASMVVYVEDTDATYKRALQAGATSVMEPADQFYGDRNAGVRDPSGNCWWIAAHKEDVSPEEVAKRAEEAFAKQRRS